jgi:glutathione S-transferase
MASNTFLHLTTKQAWEDALAVGTYSLSTKGKSLDEVGFIHGSFADQVEEVAGFVFAGSTEDLVLLHLDIDKLDSNGIEVRVEKARNGKSYPHIYGAVPCDLVDHVSPAQMSGDGKLIQD